MKTVIYFVRHAEVFNPQRVVYGRLPGFPLSREGRERAEDLANYFRSKKIAAVYSSPLLRSRQTAVPIARRLGKTLIVSKLLLETRTPLGGLPLRELRRLEPRLYEKELLARGQEAPEHILRRMRRFVRRVIREHPSRNIVAVSHGDPLVVLRANREKKVFRWSYKKQHYVVKGGVLRLAFSRDYTG